MEPTPSKTIVHHIAKAGAHRHAIRATREQILDHAEKQRDSMAPTIATLEAAVEAGTGDELSARRLRTLLTERHRLTTLLNRRLERA